MSEQPTARQTTCHFHPDRVAGVRCQRCDKPICPSCMHQASVGFHCPECVANTRQRVYKGPQVFGAARGTPVVTMAIVIINVVVWFASIASGDTVGGGVSADGLLFDGALNAQLITFQDEWYRIFTSGFLHFGLWHIAINMFMLWIIGSRVEPEIGPVRFGVLYIASLLAGSFGALLLSPDALTAGASGAVYGLFGFVAASQWRRGWRWWDTGIGTLVIINLVFAFIDVNISVGGHLGGLIGGAVVALIYHEIDRFLGQRWVAPLAASLVGVALFFASLETAQALA